MVESSIKKISVACLGTGNIGTDLLIKIIRSKYLECEVFAGQRKDSPGIAKAKSLGIKTSCESIKAVMESNAQTVFDCTNAIAHKQNAPKLKDKFCIDLTPAKLGMMCVPDLNLKEALLAKEISLISCGAQVVIPRIVKIKNLEYVEVVTTIASKAAGMGTRQNISEYLKTTAEAITKFCHVKAKAILIINPSEPPIPMHNTIYAKIKGKDKLTIIQWEHWGRGDWLPKYAGNLDVINNAAIRIAEKYAQNTHN